MTVRYRPGEFRRSHSGENFIFDLGSSQGREKKVSAVPLTPGSRSCQFRNGRKQLTGLALAKRRKLQGTERLEPIRKGVRYKGDYILDTQRGGVQNGPI